MKGLNKVRLKEASFVWTEPHSRRLIVRLTIQKEVFGAILEQQFDVTFVVKTQQCDLCTRAMANDTWTCVAQVRQKVNHKRTFLYLEQMIIKHNAQKDCIKIKVFLFFFSHFFVKYYFCYKYLKNHPDGIDFFFNNQNHMNRFSQFIQDFAPCRYDMYISIYMLIIFFCFFCLNKKIIFF